MSLVECVPNFSEGRRPAVLEAIVAALRGVPGVRVLDHSLDPDHNRAVVTFAGPFEAVEDGAFRAVREAAERIDLTAHEGVHPRMGATDVCPFIPLADAGVEDCVALAHRVGARVGGELAIPVYYYGDAARRPERRSLPDVRRGGFEALRDAIGSAPERAPDDGPQDAIHPTAGATAVGVRPFLIAFNMNLSTDDVGVARRIARSIRESSGGLPGIRALGLPVHGRKTAQVSVNVCDHRRTGLAEVFEAVQALASELGHGIEESELVGLAPRAALDAELASRVKLRDFDPRRCLIEEVCS